MEDRIEINGVWYVKEQPITLPEIEITSYLCHVAENDRFCFEAQLSSTVDDELKANTMLDWDWCQIKTIDKRVQPYQTSYWDNNSWMKGVLENNPLSVNELEIEHWETSDILFFQAFLKHLKKEDWL